MTTKLLTRLGGMRRNLVNVLTSKDRKSLPRLATEFLGCSVRMRGPALHYFTSFLYRKTVCNVGDYLSHREMKELQDAINEPSLAHIVSNKLLFLEHFGEAGLPVPRLLAYNVLEKLYVQRDSHWRMQELLSAEDMAMCLRELAAVSTTSEIFVKLVSGTCGIGAKKLPPQSVAGDPIGVGVLWKDVVKGCHLIQEVVAQHPALDELNSSSLNTVRIDTFKEPGKAPEVLSALLRVGRDRTWVDNIAAGGLFVGIDLDRGTLRGAALGKLGKGGSSTYIHPNSKVCFDGFRLPYFAQVVDLAKRAAACLPSALVGWDIGISPTGPVLIEGNALYYDMQLSDVAYGGYRKNPVWQRANAFVRERRSEELLSERAAQPGKVMAARQR